MRSFVPQEGLRFPLGVASAELSILSYLPESEVGGYLNGADLEGSWSMGTAVFDEAGRPAWALSLTGIESRFRADGREELGRLLLEQAHAIGALKHHDEVTVMPLRAGRG